MFTSFKLTNNGKAMHIKSVFGDSIKFTKVAFGSGAKPDGIPGGCTAHEQE